MISGDTPWSDARRGRPPPTIDIQTDDDGWDASMDCHEPAPRDVLAESGIP